MCESHPVTSEAGLRGCSDGGGISIRGLTRNFEVSVVPRPRRLPCGSAFLTRQNACHSLVFSVMNRQVDESGGFAGELERISKTCVGEGCTERRFRSCVTQVLTMF